MVRVQTDLLAAEALSPLAGSPLIVCDVQDASGSLPAGGVLVAVDRHGELPPLDAARFDVMVTTRDDAPRPWVSVPATRLDARLAAITATAARCPIATAMLARVLRTGEGLSFEAAIELESLAYSTLLGGGEFARWLASVDRGDEGEPCAGPVRYDREGDAVTLTLASPGNHNAMTAAMRDALYEALVNVLEDPGGPTLDLRAEGKCFSTGGSLAEFGTARDLAAAHVIRTQRSCARVLHRIGARGTAHLQGLCIGSGIEIAAAAARRTGRVDTIVQLPELRMGLIPGAGGTVTMARAIGRHRLLWLALGAFRLGAGEALAWGLLHAIEP